MNLYDASDIKNVKYGCTEYAVKRLTGRDLLEETGKNPGEIGFENAEILTGGQCAIEKGSISDLMMGVLDRSMIRIRPKGQEELHTVIVIAGRGYFPEIEDQSSRRKVFIADLIEEWNSAGQKFSRCDFTRHPNKSDFPPSPFLVEKKERT